MVGDGEEGSKLIELGIDFQRILKIITSKIYKRCRSPVLLPYL